MLLISTDFDATIYDSSASPCIDAEWVEWMRQAQGRGTKWIINTGRGLMDVVSTVESLKLKIWPDFVVSVERHIHLRQDQGYHDHALWNAACHKDHQLLFRETKNFFLQIRRSVSSRYKVQFYEETLSPLCIMAVHLHEADLIHQHVEEECRRVRNLTVVRNSEFFRFSHAAYSKGTALGEIANSLGIGREAIFAAGDHFNDLPMLDGVHAANVAAPSNAVPAVKAVVAKVGGYIAERSYSQGVLEALKFFEAKNSA